MRPEALQEAREWLARAGRDLHVAAAALKGTEIFPDDAAFHAQQAAEKALKSFLAAHNQPFPRIHNLERLVDQCRAIDPGFAPFVGAAQTLNPYVTRFRYPGGPTEPSLSEAQQAVGLADEIYRFVRTRLFPGEPA